MYTKTCVWPVGGSAFDAHGMKWELGIRVLSVPHICGHIFHWKKFCMVGCNMTALSRKVKGESSLTPLLQWGWEQFGGFFHSVHPLVMSCLSRGVSTRHVMSLWISVLWRCMTDTQTTQSVRLFLAAPVLWGYTWTCPSVALSISSALAWQVRGGGSWNLQDHVSMNTRGLP